MNRSDERLADDVMDRVLRIGLRELHGLEGAGPASTRQLVRPRSWLVAAVVFLGIGVLASVFLLFQEGETRVMETSTPTQDPEPEVPPAHRRLSRTYRDSAAHAVFADVAEASGVPLVVGPGVVGTVDFDFTNVPAFLVIEKLAENLNAEVVELGGGIRVVRRPARGDDGPGRPPSPRITLSLEGVHVGTAARTLAQTGLAVEIDEDVDGVVTLDCRDQPVFPALRSALRPLGCVMLHRVGGGVRIVAAGDEDESQHLDLVYHERSAGDAIAAIASRADRNIVIPAESDRPISLQLRDVPWRRALEAVAEALGGRVVEADQRLLRIEAP